MSRWTRDLARASIVGVTLAFAHVASADMTKEQCIRANADGQALRLDGKLALAREQLQACATPACPTIVFSDCTKRAAEIDRLLPTIQLDVVDRSGAPVRDVRVTVDGKGVERGIAQPLALDPGEHTFTITSAAHLAVTHRWVLKEGQKGRLERVVLDPLPVAVVAPVADTSTTGAMSTRRVVALVVGGTGIATVAIGAVFGVMTFAAVSAQHSDCSAATTCPDRNGAANEHASVNSDGAISTATFVVGGALVAPGAALYLTAPHEGSGGPSHAFVVAPSIGPHGGGFSIGARF